MTIALDAVSWTTPTPTTGDSTFSLNPSATTRGVLVLIVHEVGTDTVAGVTYDGVAMGQIAGSPLLHTAPETGSVHAFFLGSNVPTTDPATVAIDVTDTSDYVAAGFTFTAAADTEIHDVTIIDSGSLDDPSGVLTITRTSFCVGALYSGLAGVADVDAGANTVIVVEADLGQDTSAISRSSIGTTASDFTFGWTTSGADDAAAILVAVTEVLTSQPFRSPYRQLIPQ